MDQNSMTTREIVYFNNTVSIGAFCQKDMTNQNSGVFRSRCTHRVGTMAERENGVNTFSDIVKSHPRWGMLITTRDGFYEIHQLMRQAYLRGIYEKATGK